MKPREENGLLLANPEAAAARNSIECEGGDRDSRVFEMRDRWHIKLHWSYPFCRLWKQ